MRCKIVHLVLGLFHVLLLPEASVGDGGYMQCEHAVKNWASVSANSEVSGNQHALRDLLLFLHVPRTGGRTYYHCFLKKLYPSQECPRSYDKLRYNTRKSDCRLLATHDDYSVMSKLPRERTSVMTILRDPIQHFLSSYEFSIEVAARFLIHPNLTSVTRVSRAARRKKTSGVSTLDIWPWKYLVPWMREDLFARRDARKLRGQVHLLNNDPYDMEDIVMPLREYINDPITQDIVHNGATFQIVGLTNNSYSSESHEVRHCVLKYRSLGEYVLEVAKKKLDNMLYVGLTENHKESANVFANVVAAQVISKHKTSTSNSYGAEDNDDSEQGSSLLNSDAIYKDDNIYQNMKNASSTEDDKAVRENLTVGKLMEAYNSCISALRKAQTQRRVDSLKRIAPANFTKEARRKIPDALIQEMASLNSLDVELYKYGQYIFEKQHKLMKLNMVYDETITGSLSVSTHRGFYSAPSWKFVCLSITGFMLLIFIFVFVNSRRRTSKVKL